MSSAKLLAAVKRFLATYGLILPMAIASLACAFIPSGSSSNLTTVTPSTRDIVTYLVPLYSTTLKPGDTVPWTRLTYVSRDDNTYNVTIDGLPAAKRVGDSFNWRGVIAPGVVAKYNLRISPTFVSDNLLAGGPVELAVLNPIPVELENTSAVTSGPIHFGNIAVEYSVAKGGQIGGTSLVYEGARDQEAELSGTSGYPYRAAGDSLIWTGRLRGNVTVRYSLRVTNVSEESLHLLGTAELWITPIP